MYVCSHCYDGAGGTLKVSGVFFYLILAFSFLSLLFFFWCLDLDLLIVFLDSKTTLFGMFPFLINNDNAATFPWFHSLMAGMSIGIRVYVL